MISDRNIYKDSIKELLSDTTKVKELNVPEGRELNDVINAQDRVQKILEEFLESNIITRNNMIRFRTWDIIWTTKSPQE